MALLGCALMPHPPLMLPEIGGAELKKMEATVRAMEEAARAVAAREPETVVVISPHGLVLEDAISIYAAERLRGDMREFGRPELTLEYAVDREVTRRMIECCRHRAAIQPLTAELAARWRLPLAIDKGSFVPLYYLAQAGFHGQIVQLGISLAPYEQMMLYGRCMREALAMSGRRAVVIASGDLSHRLRPNSPHGYTPRGRVFDDAVTAALRTLDQAALLSMDRALIREAGECGLPSIFFMLGALEGGRPARPRILSYEAPFGVGYAVGLFMETSDKGGAANGE